MNDKKPVKPKKTVNLAFVDRIKGLPRIGADHRIEERQSEIVKAVNGEETAVCSHCDQLPLYSGKLWIDGDEVEVRLCGKCYVAAGNPSGLRKIFP